MLSADDWPTTVPRVPEIPDGIVDTTVVPHRPQPWPRKASLTIYQPAVLYGPRQRATTGDEVLPSLQPLDVHQVPDVGLGGVVLPDELLLLNLASLQRPRVHAREGLAAGRDRRRLSQVLAVGLGAHAPAASVVRRRGRIRLARAIKAAFSPSLTASGRAASSFHRSTSLPIFIDLVVGLGALPLGVRAVILRLVARLGREPQDVRDAAERPEHARRR
mmetsp:Transcript_81722/g.210429  ORF Transcript_81722/g.210429 Transcript_81722/m.210429 type:complete len:218 (+) Transcript_81722:1138-1791(+)